MNSNNKRALLCDFVADMGIWFRAPAFSDLQMQMYVEAYMPYDLDQIKIAFKIYTENPEHTRPPLPSQLIAYLKPSDEMNARDAVARIMTALARYGGDFQEHVQKARAHMGELGWAIVENYGSWSHMKQMSYDELGPTAQAQMREVGVLIQRKHKLGIGDKAPGLPEQAEMKPASLSHISDIVKQIEEKRN